MGISVKDQDELDMSIIPFQPKLTTTPHSPLPSASTAQATNACEHLGTTGNATSLENAGNARDRFKRSVSSGKRSTSCVSGNDGYDGG